MPFKAADVRMEYAKNDKLREEDIKALQQWCLKQPHLPTITELQLILFLQSCYFSLESAKLAIDSFYKAKGNCPEFFCNRDPLGVVVKETINVTLYAPLPKPTPENYRLLYTALMDGNSSKYFMNEQFKLFDMNMMLWLMQEGSQEGLVIILDMKLTNLGHMTRLSIVAVKKFLMYLQEAMPVRLLGLHLINVPVFMDKLLTITKPFIKSELFNMIHLHGDSLESLCKFVPQECLPKDLGGAADSISDLHASMKKRLIDNADYFKEEETHVADESKRPKSERGNFGIHGSFKKLDID